MSAQVESVAAAAAIEPVEEKTPISLLHFRRRLFRTRLNRFTRTQTRLTEDLAKLFANKPCQAECTSACCQAESAAVCQCKLTDESKAAIV